MAIIYSPYGSNPTGALPSYTIDGFGRMKVGEPLVELIIDFTKNAGRRLITSGEVSGSDTTLTIDSTSTSALLAVGTNNGLHRLRSNIAGVYQGGKSLEYMFTFNFNSTGDTAIVLRNNITGSIVETTIPQASWNKDTLDGNGPSGYNLDWTKCQLGFIQIRWLGVGNVDVGFIIGSEIIICHTFNHVNQLSVPYMSTANLFPTYEIERDNGVNIKRAGYFSTANGIFLEQRNGSNNFRAICSSLFSYGASHITANSYSVKRDVGNSLNTGTGGAARVVMAFRLNPSNLYGRIKVVSIDVNVSSNSDYYVSIVRSPTFNNTFSPTWVALPKSSLQYDCTYDNNSIEVTNAEDNTVYTATGNKQNDQAGGNIETFDFLGVEYDDTPEIWVVTITSDTVNEVVNLASVKFIEYV